MNNVVNKVPYLRTSRSFPSDIIQLAEELNKSYIDIALAVNNRTISLFTTSNPVITGETWFFGGIRQQTLRKLFTFTSTSAIDHGIQVTSIAQFTSCYGSFSDGTNCYGLFFASNVGIVGQITFYLTPTQIVFVVGAGAPVLTSGRIVLEWLSEP